MRIVHIPRRMTRASWGGTETVVHQLTQAQAAAGLTPEIQTTQALDSKPFERVGSVPLRRHPYIYPWLRVPSETKDAMDLVGGNLYSESLRRTLLRGDAPDVYHLHTGKRLGAAVRSVAMSRGRPYIVTLHGGITSRTRAAVSPEASVPSPKWEWGKALGLMMGSRRVLQDAAAVVYLDPADAPFLESVGVQRAVHIPNGVDSSAFQADGVPMRQQLGLTPEDRLIGLIGRVDPQKNQLEAVRMFAQWKRDNPKLHLALAGAITDPAYHESVDLEIAHLGLEGSVHRLGELNSDTELPALYDAADAVIVPSVHEPFGVVILEAWAAGTPVIANRVGGIPTFVQNESDALLVAPGDREGWRCAVLSTLNRKEETAQRIRRAKHRAHAEFDWRRIADQYQALYEQVIAETGLAA